MVVKLSNRFTAAAAITVLSGGAAMAEAGKDASGNAWFKSGQATLQEVLARQPITGKAKNVILFVADGNSVSTNYATRVYKGQQDGGYGDETVLAKEALPYLALAKTYNTNAQTRIPPAPLSRSTLASRQRPG